MWSGREVQDRKGEFVLYTQTTPTPTRKRDEILLQFSRLIVIEIKPTVWPEVIWVRKDGRIRVVGVGTVGYSCLCIA
jgi:hypothetical protein